MVGTETLLLQLSQGQSFRAYKGSTARCLRGVFVCMWPSLFCIEGFIFFCRNRFCGWSSLFLQQTALSPAKREHAGRVVGSLCVSLGKEGRGFEGQRGGNLNLWVSLLVPFPGPSLLICQHRVRETRSVHCALFLLTSSALYVSH